MDRTRESRRGGGHAVSGHVTARRRPRSAFKDSSVVCDEEEGMNESHDSSRLRERSTSNNIGNSSSKKERSSLSSNRSKRKRPSLPERFHGRDREMERDEGDDSSEESSAAEVEEEEEDDDEPPHRPPVNPNSNLNPKRTAKFKSQWKVSEELMGVGLVSVPRKARSASAKRHHDSSSSSPSPLLLAASVSAASDCNPQRRQKSPSPGLANVATGASPSSSNASLKSGRRMKPIGSKPKPSKMAKVSNSISESEVEVAEVLYGLTRQFQSEHHRPGVESYGNANPSKECLNDGSLAGVISRVSSPMIPPSSSVVSSPSSSPLPQHSTSAAASGPGQAPPTAPKKKRPRPAKPDEANCATVMRPPAAVSLTNVVASFSSGIRNENEPSSQYQPAAKIEVSSLKLEALARNPSWPNANANANVNVNQVPTATPTPPPPVPANQNQKENVMPDVGDNTSASLNPIASGKSKEVEMSDLKTSCENTTPESKTIASQNAGADIKVESIDPEEKKPSEDLDVSEAQIDRIEKKEMEMPCGSETKMESTIIPHQSPKTENIVEEKFQIDLMAPPEKSEDEIVADGCGIAASEPPRDEQITQIPEMKAVEEAESREGESKAEEMEIKREKSDEGEEKGLEKQNVKERGINLELDLENPEDPKKPLQQMQSKITRNESKTEKAEKLVSAAAVGTSASGVASMPIAMPGQAWPGVLSLGYFASASTNWPGAPSLLEGTNTTAAIQPPYVFQPSRQTWKRCATHSYIAHFIDCQQRMAQLPFWPAANYLGSRQYNLNAPFPSSSEIINFRGSVSGTVSASGAGNNISINRGLDSLHDKGIGTTPLVEFNSQSVKEKISNNTEPRRKQPSNQQETRQTSSTVMQCGVGGANSSTAGKSGNAEVPLNSSPASVGAVPNVGTGPANSNLASISADAQYMAMLQSGYHYAINPHFGSGYNGAPNQIFNTPFYATQLLQPQSQSQSQSQQQGPQNPSTSSGSSSSQQHKQQVQGSRKFPAPRKQQQQGTPSPSPSNSQQHHHLPTSQARHIDREANNEGDSPSTADSRHPILQKNFYSSGSPNNSNLGVTSLLASGVRLQAQDLTLMPALGGKQNGKQQLPPQLQHQIAAGYTIQQHHGNDPTVQMSLKGLELSQPHAQAIAAITQNSGLLCFPSMAQGIPESARHQMAAAVQAQQNAVQPGLHPQRSGQLQRTQISNTCDERSIVDSMINAGGRGHDEERKSSMKGGLAHSLNFSRIETENFASNGSPTDGGLSTSLVANNMDSMSKIQSRSSQPPGNSSQGSPQLSSSQQLNQNTKHNVSRAKNVPNSNIAPTVASAQSTMSGYPDRAAVPSNLSKFQTPLSPFPGQNLKQGQQSPQWKMAPRTVAPSNIPTAAGGQSQAIFVPAMKNYPQQQRNQQGNTNTGTSSVGSPQASYVTNTKNSGQLQMNQKNNSTSVTASRVPSPNVSSVVGSVPTSSASPVSKSVGSPASRSPTGSKGSSLQQKSVAPSSNKRSSPVSSRSMPSVLGPSQGSQSSSGKSPQQQYQQQQQQSMPHIASGQPAGLKNQQYHNQTQHLLLHAQILQQQSQLPAQTGQLSGFHQKQQMHGSNSAQPSFSSAHLRQQQEQHQQMHGSNSPQPSFSASLRQQEQQQQMQSASSTQSTPGMLSLGPPTLTLGGATVPGKVNAGGSLVGGSKGNTMLQTQYGQRVVAEVLNQEQINGVRMMQNSANLCTSASQNRGSFNTSSPQSSSTRMPPGSLKKPEGANSVETTTNSSGLSLSMAPCSGIRTNNSGLTAGGNAKTASVSLAGVHSSQMPHMPIHHQPAVPLVGGSIAPATSNSTGLHGQTASSMVQP